MSTRDADEARSTRRGRPTGDHAKKRAELLAAATSVIAEVGFAGASLRKVAERAGCTTGAVTYYFANKEELVTALAESRFDHYDAMLGAVRDGADLRELGAAWLATATADPEYWPVMSQLLLHARSEPALTAVIAERYSRFREVYTAILARGQQQGTIRDDISADLLADQLTAMGDGWMLMYPFEPKRFTPERLRALVDAQADLVMARPRH